MKKVTSIIVAFVLFASAAVVFTACELDDVSKPVITLTGGTSVDMSLNGTWTDPGFTATDDEDGDLTASVVVSGTVNVDLAGDYVLTYTVTDAAGNVGTATRTVTVANDSEDLVGSYNVTDQVTGGSTYNYTDNITTSSTTNNKIWVSSFAFYDNGAVYFTRSGNNVNIPQQVVNCGNPAADRQFSGSGTISGTTITINYTEITNGTTVTGIETYTKQ